tara:strand:- start:241 stop:1374 length:1134 start_codon:yes stop_codon:yes gene_type:complete
LPNSLRILIFILKLFCNGTLSMMNIRDYLLINKTKRTNKIKILELLGFESDTLIEDISNNDVLTEEVDTVNKETFETLLTNTEEIRIPTSSIDTYIADNTASTKVVNQTPTDTFNPINITEQIQRVWSDLESRRKWVMPTFILLSLTFVITIASNTYMNYTETQEAVVEQAEVVTNNSNELVSLLPDLINISTNTFYSKYDVSNASASLQQIESSLIQYRDNLQNRNDIVNIDSVDENLTSIFNLVNELDLVLSYRILISEVLIYSELAISEENVDIEAITADLSNVIAQSKVNYASLPDIEEFNKHKLLVNDAITTAENLHGRYLGALRNNEYDVAQSIATAIILNKETESNAFESALLQFKEKSLINLANFSNLP